MPRVRRQKWPAHVQSRKAGGPSREGNYRLANGRVNTDITSG